MVQKSAIASNRIDTKAPVSEGDSALKLVAQLPHLIPNIAKLTFSVYVPKPTFERRVAHTHSALTRQLREGLAKMWSSNSVDDAAIEAIVALYATDYDQFLRESTRHDNIDESQLEFRLPADEICEQVLADRLAQLPSGTALGLSSICELRGGRTAHLPLLDFKLSASEGRDILIEKAVRSIGTRRGFIIETGNSYHYYGLDVMNSNEWVQFLGHSLLLAPIVDTRYIAHRLIAGRCVVRIAPTRTKPDIPFVRRILLEPANEKSKSRV